MAYKQYEELTEDELQQLEQCGGVGFSYSDVAVIFGLDPSEVREQFRSKQGCIYERYHVGRLQAELILRQNILNSANNGSSPSQLYMMKLYEQADTANNELNFS
jgi:hypothetical protein